jgi:hypothetical protein
MVYRAFAAAIALHRAVAVGCAEIGRPVVRRVLRVHLALFLGFLHDFNNLEFHIVETGLTTCLQKTGLETGLSAQNQDKLLDRIF